MCNKQKKGKKMTSKEQKDNHIEMICNAYYDYYCRIGCNGNTYNAIVKAIENLYNYAYNMGYEKAFRVKNQKLTKKL